MFYQWLIMRKSKCSCGKECYLIPNMSVLRETKSKKSQHWYNWAVNYRNNFCQNSPCNLKEFKIEYIAIPVIHESEEEKEFLEFLRTKELSDRRSFSRKTEGKTTTEQFNKIAELQKYKCYFCLYDLTSHPEWYDPAQRGSIANWDHLDPASKGGSNWPINMALTCKSCNAEKSFKSEAEYWKHLESKGKKELVLEAKKFHKSYHKEKLKI